jgi:prephenate dehydratase
MNAMHETENESAATNIQSSLFAKKKFKVLHIKDEPSDIYELLQNFQVHGVTFRELCSKDITIRSSPPLSVHKIKLCVSFPR